MNIFFYIQPRQSGKTTKAIKQFLKDPKNSIFITIKSNENVYIRELLYNYKNRVMDCNEFLNNNLNFTYIDNIIIDEYMLFTNKHLLYTILKNTIFKSIFIYTSVNKLYSIEIFDYVKKNKYKYSYSEFVKNFFSEKKIKHTMWMEEELYELYYNLITDKETIILDNHFDKNIKKYNYKSLMNNEILYKIEILNQYLHY